MKKKTDTEDLSAYEYLRKPKLEPAARPISSIFREFTKRYGLEQKQLRIRVVSIYHEQMGKAISQVTQKIYASNEGVLFLRLESSTLQDELFNQRTQLIKLLNEELGTEFVKEIKFI